MYIHVCGIEGCRVRDFVRLAGVLHLWGRDTGCVLKPLTTLFSFDSDQRRHATTQLTNGTRSVDPQDTSKICVHTRSIWYIRSLYAPREQSWLGITPFLTTTIHTDAVVQHRFRNGHIVCRRVLAMKRNKHSNLIGQFKHTSHEF